jgi:hypothetical protein
VFDDQVIASCDHAPITLCHLYDVDADSGIWLSVSSALLTATAIIWLPISSPPTGVRWI